MQCPDSLSFEGVLGSLVSQPSVISLEEDEPKDITGLERVTGVKWQSNDAQAFFFKSMPELLITTSTLVIHDQPDSKIWILEPLSGISAIWVKSSTNK
jgi:hypothetical protein